MRGVYRSLTFRVLGMGLLLLGVTAPGIKSANGQQPGRLRTNRVPKPIEPFQTLTYEDRKGTPRLAAHFSDKISTYISFGKIQFNVQYGDRILEEGPTREGLMGDLMTIWDGRSPRGIYIDPKKEEMVFNGRHTVLMFRASTADQAKFPADAMDRIHKEWVDHYHAVLEPAKLWDLSSYEKETVGYAIFWGDKPMPEGPEYESVRTALNEVFQGRDSAILKGDAWGNLSYREIPMTLGFYVHAGRPEQQVLLQYDRHFRSIVKEVLHVRRNLANINSWKTGWINAIKKWKTDELAKATPFAAEVATWHADRLKDLEKIPSLYVRNEAIKQLEADHVRRQSALDGIHGQIDQEHLHRIQFINAETVRQTKEFELLGKTYGATGKAKMDPELAKWKEFDTKLEETRKAIKTPAPAAALKEPSFAGDLEKKFPLQLKLPPGCDRFKIQLEITNELKLILVNPGESINLISGIGGIRSIACQDDAMLIVAEQVDEIPADHFKPVPTSLQEAKALVTPQKLGRAAILIKGDKVVYLLKGLTRRPLARVENSTAAGFFDVWLEQSPTEYSKSYVVRIRNDGEKIDTPRFYEPPADAADISELKDVSERFVHLRPEAK